MEVRKVAKSARVTDLLHGVGGISQQGCRRFQAHLIQQCRKSAAETFPDQVDGAAFSQPEVAGQVGDCELTRVMIKQERSHHVGARRSIFAI